MAIPAQKVERYNPMKFTKVAPPANAVSAKEFRHADYTIRVNDYGIFTNISVAFGEVRHMDCPARNPQASGGLVEATWIRGEIQVSVLAPKSRTVVHSIKNLIAKDIFAILVSMRPGAVKGADGDFTNGAWETMIPGF